MRQGRRRRTPLNDFTLERDIFPRLAQKLREAGEVYVDYDFASNFAHYIMRHHYELWTLMEQQLRPTEDLRARFFLRDV